MRLIVDANVVLAAILGRRGRFTKAIEAGVELFIPEAQLSAVVKVLIRTLGIAPLNAETRVSEVIWGLGVIEMESLLSARDAALARLGPRGEPDWPVLAAALLLDADIWSDDRDFCGVGIATWSHRTIDIAIAQAAAA